MSTDPAQPADPPVPARSALIVGLAVGVALLAMWWPATSCEGDGFSCLGWVVVTIFATPVVAFVVGLVVGALMRLRRPWLLALLGPFAAFGALRTTVSVLGPELPALLITGLLVALAYAGIAVLLRPGTSSVLRVGAAILVTAMIFLPGVIESATS
jgi:hypothetical protein